MNFHSGDLWLSRDMPGVPIPQYLSCRCLEIEGAASLEPQEQGAASLEPQEQEAASLLS